MTIFVITGASDGIGAEMARQLAQSHGAQAGIVLAARNRETLEAVAAQCRDWGAQTLVAVTDVTASKGHIRGGLVTGRAGRRAGPYRLQRDQAQGKLGRFAKLLAPGMVENMALSALKDHVRPR